jgi:hypothetical protein
MSSRTVIGSRNLSLVAPVEIMHALQELQGNNGSLGGWVEKALESEVPHFASSMTRMVGTCCFQDLILVVSRKSIRPNLSM